MWIDNLNLIVCEFKVGYKSAKSNGYGLSSVLNRIALVSFPRLKKHKDSW